MCGVEGRAIGVRLVPVLFEFFLDSTLGGGELHGCGSFGELGTGPFDRLRVNGGGTSFDGLCFDPFDRLRGAKLRVSGAFGGAQDRLGTSGVGCGATAPAAPLVC